MSGARDLPKLRLIKEKQPSGPASLAIRFNAASMRDDDDDEGGIQLATPTPSPDDPPQARVSAEFEDSTTSSPATSYSDKSFLGGIKDHLPGQFTAIIDRIEDARTGEASERKIKKSDSQESDGQGQVVNGVSKEQKQSRSNSIDDVFVATVKPEHSKFEAPIEFTATSSEIPLDSGVKTKSRLSPLRRFRHKSDTSQPGAVATVHMSTLLSNNKDEEEEQLLADDEEEFFDPREEGSPVEDAKDALNELKTKNSTTANVNVAEAQPSLVLPRPRVLAVFIAVLGCMIAPLPPFLSGLLAGLLFGCGGVLVYQWLTAPPQPKPVLELEPLENLPPICVPEMRESSNEPGKFKGWLNELSHYDPDDYHISSTRCVYVQLEGSNLRLQSPKVSVPKRAMWNEPVVQHSTFVHQRFINLSSSVVYLLPARLVKKRLWSKKYPICIALATKPQDCPKTPEKKDGQVDLSSTASAKDLGFEVIDKNNKDGKMLYLFARTSREKEEWYRRFYAASKSTPLPSQMVGLLTKLYEAQKSRPSSVSSEKDADLLTANRAESTGASTLSHSATDSNIATTAASISTTAASTSLGTTSLPTLSISPELLHQHLHPPLPATPSLSPEALSLSYLRYMARLMPTDSLDRFFASAGPTLSRKVFQFGHGLAGAGLGLGAGGQSRCDDGVVWLNALLGRLLWDFLRDKYWADIVKEKIQRKLSKIHVPYFIDELTVTGIDLGKEIPLIRRITHPYIDDRGLWIDMDVAYGGGFTMSLETKVNLMKLKKKDAVTALAKDIAMSEKAVAQDFMNANGEKRSPATNSDEEDSAESSTDDELEDTVQDTAVDDSRTQPKRNLRQVTDQVMRKLASSRYVQKAAAKSNFINTKLLQQLDKQQQEAEADDNYDIGDNADNPTDVKSLDAVMEKREHRRGHAGSSNTSKKILRLVDKIAASRYFQQATENKYIKKAMEEVSNTRLMLTVELRSVVGVMAVNIPPPPTDRMWYGFRTNPSLYLSAKPQVGERTISVSHITDWIEKKLAIEFQRILVFPNMDDLPIPLMCDEQPTQDPPETS